MAVNIEHGVVAWTSWNTLYMFLWSGGNEVKVVDLGSKTGGNIRNTHYFGWHSYFHEAFDIKLEAG